MRRNARHSAIILLTLALAGWTAGLVCPINGLADSPLPDPSRVTIWSPNKAFFAVMDPVDWITTVYRATPDGKGTAQWAMLGWFRAAYLADDGEHLVTDPFSMSLLPLDYDKKQAMLYSFRRGELIKIITLDQVAGDPPKLRRTASHFSIGGYLGFRPDGRFGVQPIEGDEFSLDVMTRTTIPEARKGVPQRRRLLPEDLPQQ